MRKAYVWTVIVLLSLSLAVGGCISQPNAKNPVRGTVLAEMLPRAQPRSQDAGKIVPVLPEEVMHLFNHDQDILLLDVREESEFRKNHIGGAKLLPVGELEHRMDELPIEKTIILYCRSGTRSRNAAVFLVENGFGTVYDMGGIISWIQKGYPVVSEDSI